MSGIRADRTPHPGAPSHSGLTIDGGGAVPRRGRGRRGGEPVLPVATALVPDDDGLDELLGMFERPLDLLGDLGEAAVNAGHPYAAVYVEGARSALRLAFAAAARRGGGPAAAGAGDLPLPLGVGNIAVRRRGDGALVERGRIAERDGVPAFAVEPTAEAEAGPFHPGLADDLVADARLGELASGPAFAALLAAALGSHRWVHLATGRTARMTVPVARTVVSLLSRGRAYPLWPLSFAGRMLDVEVCRELVRIGWHRIAPPGLDAESERRTAEAMGVAEAD